MGNSCAKTLKGEMHMKTFHFSSSFSFSHPMSFIQRSTGHFEAILSIFILKKYQYKISVNIYIYSIIYISSLSLNRDFNFSTLFNFVHKLLLVLVKMIQVFRMPDLSEN